MTADIIPLRRTESVRQCLLRMSAAGHSLQAALAIWFDLLHKRSPEDRDVRILTIPEIVSERSIVFARIDAMVSDDAIFVGGELTRTHEAIAAETVRGASLATPIAFTHEWGRGQSANSLVLPFGHPHHVVVVLFDW